MTGVPFRQAWRHGDDVEPYLYVLTPDVWTGLVHLMLYPRTGYPIGGGSLLVSRFGCLRNLGHHSGDVNSHPS